MYPMPPKKKICCVFSDDLKFCLCWYFSYGI